MVCDMQLLHVEFQCRHLVHRIMFHSSKRVRDSFLFIIVLLSMNMVRDESGTTRTSSRSNNGDGVAADRVAADRVATANSLGGRKRKSGVGKARGKKRRTDPGRHNNCSVEDELELAHQQSGSWEEHVNITSVRQEVTTTTVPLFTLPNHFPHLTQNELEQDSRHEPRRTAATDMEQRNTTYTATTTAVSMCGSSGTAKPTDSIVVIESASTHSTPVEIVRGATESVVPCDSSVSLLSSGDSSSVLSERKGHMVKYMKCIGEDTEDGDEKRVKEFVVLKLFAMVKFLASPSMLNTYVRKLVEVGMNIPEEDRCDSWWYRYRKLVRNAISEKRSNITSDMKRRFLKGTFCVVAKCGFCCQSLSLTLLSCITNTANKEKSMNPPDFQTTIVVRQATGSYLLANTLPSLQDIFGLGASNINGAYTYAFLYIFPSCVGWLRHRSDVVKFVPSRCFNSSDEALALILLENNYDMWVALGRGQLLEPKYTARFIKKGLGSAERKVSVPGYAGWSYAGIKRFLEIKKAVEEDRKKPERIQLETLFLKNMKLLQDELTQEQHSKGGGAKVVSDDAAMMESEEVWMDLVATPEDNAGPDVREALVSTLTDSEVDSAGMENHDTMAVTTLQDSTIVQI